MAFPSVQATATTAISSTVTSHVINLPSGITAGNLLIIFFTYATIGQTLTGPTGWTLLVQAEHTTGTTEGAAVYYRIATGGEGTTVTITTSASTRSASVSARITGHTTELAPTQSNAIGSNANADPPAHTPSGGAKDYLWLALGANAGNTNYTAAPTNYTGLVVIAATAGNQSAATKAGWSTRQLNAASEDPGAYTGGDEGGTSEWVGITVAVHPPANGGAQISGAEFEVPSLSGRADVSGAEFEVPFADGRSDISGAEFEVPFAAGRSDVSGAELEVPLANGRSDVSGAEFEVPDVSTSGRAEVSGAELEVPFAPGAAEVSGAEFEVPFAPGSAQISGAEFEVPFAPADAEISGAEFEVPFAAGRSDISGAEFEVPLANGQAEVSGAEFEVPFAAGRTEISGAEFEVPDIGGLVKRKRVYHPVELQLKEGVS